MKKIILIIFLALAMMFCSCTQSDIPDLPSGAQVIDGIYISDALPVAYYFSKDGFGVQYVAGEAYRIRYYILDGKIHIENYSVEKGDSVTFDFEQSDGYIVIGGIKYMLSDDDKTIDISTSV